MIGRLCRAFGWLVLVAIEVTLVVAAAGVLAALFVLALLAVPR